jgi:hypothetical protein
VIFESGSRLERIEDYAFRESGLKSIEIPGSVTSISVSAFSGLFLDSFCVSPDNRRFRVREFFLEDFDGLTICQYFASCRSIMIPSSVVVLGKESFYECKSLGSVTFEGGSRLERIEESAFRESGLKSIEIPSSVVILGKGSFAGCRSLESVTFESGSRLERIEKSAFRESGLKSIEIPSSVVVLGISSFFQCRFLKSITFESGSRLERIEESAFRGSGLNSIEIPSSVVVLGNESFYHCTSLEFVTFESGSRLELVAEFNRNQSDSRSIAKALSTRRPSMVSPSFGNSWFLGSSPFTACGSSRGSRLGAPARRSGHFRFRKDMDAWVHWYRSLGDSPVPAADSSSFTAELLGQSRDDSRVDVTVTPMESLWSIVDTCPCAVKLSESPGVKTNPLYDGSSPDNAGVVPAAGPLLASKVSPAAPSAYPRGDPDPRSSRQVGHSGALVSPFDLNARESPFVTGSSSIVQGIIRRTSPSANSVDTEPPSFSGMETSTSMATTPASTASGRKDTTPAAIPAAPTAMDGSAGTLRPMNPITMTPHTNAVHVHVNTYGMPVPVVMGLRQEIRRIRPDVSLDDLDRAARSVATVWTTLFSRV